MNIYIPFEYVLLASATAGLFIWLVLKDKFGLGWLVISLMLLAAYWLVTFFPQINTITILVIIAVSAAFARQRLQKRK